MKKIFVLLFSSALTLSVLQTKAQAFDRNTVILGLNIGPGEMIHFPVGNNPLVNAGNPYLGENVNRAILTGQFNFQAEFAIHKYVGLGFVVGIGGRAEALGTYNYVTGYTGLGYYKEVNIPLGMLANFHFYQLIADKKGSKNLHSDKLDVYAGITAGTGVAIHPYNPPFNDVLFYFGPHAGVNYYFTPNVAVNGEVGWGTTLIQAGFNFKLRGGSKSK